MLHVLPFFSSLWFIILLPLVLCPFFYFYYHRSSVAVTCEYYKGPSTRYLGGNRGAAGATKAIRLRANFIAREQRPVVSSLEAAWQRR